MSAKEQATEAPAEMKGEARRWRPTRRGFLIAGGLSGGGIALGLKLGLPALRLRMAEGLDEAPTGGDMSRDPAAWFELLPEGRLRLHLNKVEMGQGVHTALAQIAAEELDHPIEQLQVVQATTERGPADPFGTAGSTSVAALWSPLREAAANLRDLLRATAAQRMGRSAEALRIERGFVVDPAASPEQRLSFDEILGDLDPEAWELPEAAPQLKASGEFSLIGQAVPRVDLPAKVDGSAVFGYDQRLEGMAYGAVARPPRLGAQLRSARPGQAAEMDGVIAVVIEDGFAGVVAESRQRARAARAGLELDWEDAPAWSRADFEERVSVGGRGGVTIQKEGEADSLLDRDPGAASAVEAEYRVPMAAHMPMEPQAALVDVRADAVEAWASTQMPNMLQSHLANLLGVEPESVNVHTPYLGGGFGRKFGNDVASEAARLSRAAGRPVHVGWDRREELREGYVRPPSHHVLRASLDPQNGRIQALRHLQSSGDVAFGFIPAFVSAMMGADFGATRGARIHYAGIPNRLTKAWRHTLPIRTGWWRGLGLLPNTFALESFIDELAQQQAADPLDFRLAQMGDDEDGQRLRAVLEAVAEAADWGAPMPEGRGRGLACCLDAGTVVAQVAEIELVEGEIHVTRVVCALDCGQVVNPDGARAQVEGNIMMGLSSTLVEDLEIEDGRVAATNFNRYPILGIDRAPEIETLFLDSPVAEPRGLGEPPIGPIAAAVANALFDLSGKRIRQLPLSAERIAESEAE